MERHEHVHHKVRQIFINNFIGGIAWGLGATVGLSLVIAIFGLILGKINLIPVVGEFVSQITSFVLKNNPHLLK